jgi:hypothetical protein
VDVRRNAEGHVIPEPPAGSEAAKPFSEDAFMERCCYLNGITDPDQVARVVADARAKREARP